MARFAARYRRYKISVRKEVKMTLANGKSNIIQHGVLCEFQHGGAFNHEKELAKQRFKFHGMLQEQDEATPIDPVYGVNSRVSVYDTEAPELVARWASWDKAEGLPVGTIKAEVEAALREKQGPDFFEVLVPKLPAPWPKYDTLRGAKAAERIAATVTELGLPVGEVVAYERQERDREDVIAALLALGAPEPGEELVAA